MEQVSNFDLLSTNGLMILPSPGFMFAKNTLSSPSIPEGGYVTDSNYKAIAGIAKSGDVYILENNYSLAYSTKDSHIVLQILDQNNTIVANILYNINAEYVIK